MERAADVLFLGVHLDDNLTWTTNTTTTVKKAQQRLYFLWILTNNSHRNCPSGRTAVLLGLY